MDHPVEREMFPDLTPSVCSIGGVIKTPVVFKVVEIAPAFQLDPHLRDRLHADAVSLAKQVRFARSVQANGSRPKSSGFLAVPHT